jgi:uncharacterized membrane protein
MNENLNEINQLLAKLDLLMQRQNGFQNEINDLRQQIYRLSPTSNLQQNVNMPPPQQNPQQQNPQQVIYNPQQEQQKQEQLRQQQMQQQAQQQAQQQRTYIPSPPREKTDFEKWIGENLISKIGIAILVLGVGIGAKFAIDNGWISPLTRIILGYLMGIGILGFAIKLKAKYLNFSAVLLGGALAIMYFITFLAYSPYQLIPQVMAFALMVMFTAFTVVAAINYEKQIIAHIGLVGAYAVPFLLSDGSGRVGILFTYMAILNIGILIIAFKRNWKPLYFVSFAFTWLIFISWYISKYEMQFHFTLAMVFAFVFFIIFYVTNIAYKLIKKEMFNAVDVMMILMNSFIYFGIGYSILNNQIYGSELLGLFTLGNAVIHFIVSAIIYKQKLADRNLFYLMAGLVLVFITVAVPVQLNGNWVTLIWAGEAALLFWIGRTKVVPIYEKLSYFLMVLAVFSLFQDWSEVYNTHYYDLESKYFMKPFINIYFFTSIFFIGIFTFIQVLYNKEKFQSAFKPESAWFKLIKIAIPSVLLIITYYAFNNEISYYFEQLYNQSSVKVMLEGYEDEYHDSNIHNTQLFWLINYSLLFFAIISFVNIYKIKNSLLAYINLGFNVLVLFIFLAMGLYTLSEMRNLYLDHTASEYLYYKRGTFNVWARYIAYAFACLLFYATYLYTKQDFVKTKFKMAFDLVLHTFILWVASSELIAWLDLTKSENSYKLGLSILWGVYALILIILGIANKKKYLRIAAMSLFAITLVKLFFYDISSLSTIAKTIVFILLGGLLLVISFLYNKYKTKLAEENEVEAPTLNANTNLNSENNDTTI